MSMFIGVIGPSLSVEAVIEEIKKNTLPIECIPLIYTHYVETVTIINKNQFSVDAFLFTGTTPY